MCGILAVAGNTPVDVPENLRRMQHRGPDHAGFFTEGVVTLLHTRLAIIDVSERSNQPFRSRTGNTIIAFNGEIYNYQSLRDELVRDGVTLLTTSDTEVLVEGYERHGIPFFDRLRGMWSFVIYDRTRNRYIAARDPFGIKPLLYTKHAGTAYFASELRNLRALIPLTPNTEAFKVFYNVGYFMGLDTPYTDVLKLLPGEVLSYDLATKVFSREHVVSRYMEGVQGTVTLDGLDEAFTDAVAAHYVADVPVSMLLSGGADSSLIAALSVKLGRSPTAFHVSIPKIEDTAYAKDVASHLGLTLHTEELTENALARAYEDVFSTIDEPTGDLSIIPTALIYRRIQGHTKVVLSGEGGDELFGGYLRHKALMRHRAVGPTPALDAALMRLLGTSNMSLMYTNPLVQRLRNLVQENLSDDLVGTYLKQTRVIDIPLFEREMRARFVETYAREETKRFFPALTFDTIAYLPDDLLIKCDNASMASSIEARVPFLDRVLISTAATAVHAMPATIPKKLLVKQVLARYLPERMVYRKKSGFGVPMHAYNPERFKGDFDEACSFLLKNQEAFGVTGALADLIAPGGARAVIARKYPRFAFALISAHKYFAV